MTSTEDATESPSETIRSLIARIAHAADEAPVEAYADLYTEDAVWEMAGSDRSGGKAQANRGLAEIMAATRSRRESGISGPGTATRHITSCVAVTVDSPDTARAESVWQFYADTTTTPRLSGMGRYHDTFRRIDGRWLLAARSITAG